MTDIKSDAITPLTVYVMSDSSGETAHRPAYALVGRGAGARIETAI